MNNLYENTEIVLGLAAQKRCPAPPPDICAPDFQDLAVDIRDQKLSKEDLVKKHGIGKIQAIHEAAKSLNGLGEELNWIEILDHSYRQWMAADMHQQYEQQLRNGVDPDYTALRPYLEDDQQANEDMVRASTVEPGEVDLIPSGFPPIDMWMGGQANAGVNLVLGWPKSGKTQLGIRLMGRNLATYPEKEVLYITTEITRNQVVSRAINMGEDKHLDRVWIVEGSRKVDTIFALAERIKPKLGLIVVDLLDDIAMAEGIISEPIMSHIHTTLAQIALKYKVPLWDFGQPTISMDYGQTIRPEMARYAKTIAAAKCSTLFSLYNPARPYAPKKSKDLRPTSRKKDVAWIYAWICRGRLSPLMKDAGDELEKRFPFAMPVYCDNNNWWDGSKGVERLPLSITGLEEGF